MQFPHLFSPLRIGTVTVPNRISFSAHLTNLSERLPALGAVRHVPGRARARRHGSDHHRGAVGPPDATGPTSISSRRSGPRSVPGYRELTRAVHRVRHARLRPAQPQRPAGQRDATPACRVLGPVAGARRDVPRDAQGDGARGHPRGGGRLRAVGRPRPRGRVRRHRAPVQPQLAGAPVHVAADQPPRRRVRRLASRTGCASRAR